MSNLQRLQDLLAMSGLSAVLLTHFGRVAWVSGHAEFIEKGPDPFSGGPSTAVITPTDSALVIASKPTANHLARTVEYSAYDYLAPNDSQANWCSAILDTLQQLYLGPERIGYEANSLPAQLLDAIRARFPAAELLDITKTLDSLRARKTTEEIEFIQAACTLCDVGQRVVREFARAGVSEIETYNHIQSAIQTAAGGRAPLGADVVSGERTLETGGPPSERVLRHGDLLMTDIHPRHPNGYWGDSCGTLVVDHEPTPVQRLVHQKIRDAVERGRELLRPGIRACEVDAAVRGVLNAQGYDYAHHTGHGIGTTHFEAPLIMPWNTESLVEDMVVTLEPGVYQPGIGGMRLEWSFRVTAHGGDPLTHFDLAL